MNVMRILALAIAGCGLLLCAQTQNANAEFDFAREIGTILTRKGCNGASCHGGVKGRGGFKLSSGAYHPKEDYEWIVKGGTYQVLTTEVKGERVPRVKVAEPEKSLLLLKATGAVSHGGGKRFDQDSPEYRKLVAWIRSGAPFGREPRQENRVVRLAASPRTRHSGERRLRSACRDGAFRRRTNRGGDRPGAFCFKQYRHRECG